MTAQWASSKRPGRRGFSKSVARKILKRDDYECQLRYPGCLVEATIADHVLGWADATAAGWAPEDIDDPGNGQAACSHCSSQKTRAEAARGRARRAASGKRPTEPHPGLMR